MSASPGPLTRMAGRRQLERSVFLTQLVMAAAVLTAVVFAVLVTPESLVSAVFIAGVTLIFAATVLAAVVPWRYLPKAAIVVLPAIDILAVTLLREGQSQLAVGFFYVFPVVWLATHFGRKGAIAGPTAATVLSVFSILGQEDSPGTALVARLIVVPITLYFLAAITYQIARRTKAQAVILRQQTIMLDSALQRVRSQQRTLATVLDSVPFMVVGFDASGEMSIRNEAYRKARATYGSTGSTAAFENVFREDRTTPMPDADRPSTRLRQGEEFDNTVIWLQSDEHPALALSTSGRQLRDAEGNRVGSVLVCRDVTPELRALAARDDLVASVSHELRTPLTSILGYLELVGDAPELTAGTKGMVDVAEKNADRMLALVADLLVAAQDDNHTFLLTSAPVELRAIVTAAAEAAGPAARANSVAIRVEQGPEVHALADGFRLRQIVDNLLSNAVKYNVERGTVDVSVTATDEVAVLRVVDSGLGMGAAELAHIFDRFYRADSVRQGSTHGAGLGLAIVKELVEQHGGRIEARSEPGLGTEMIVSIPLAPEGAAPHSPSGGHHDRPA